jgi:uncharacterized protein
MTPRPWATCLLLALAAGCKMDPFLYVPPRVDAYAFELDAEEPAEAVSAERVEELRIRVNEEVSLGAVYVRAEVQPSRGSILFFHGAGSHLGQQFWRIKRLSNLGYDVLGFDYRGFGTSTNLPPSEAGIGEDSLAALGWLKARSGPGAPIVYYGHSFGTAAATQRAESHPPDALLLESPMTSVEGLERDSTRMDFPISFIAEDTWDTVGRIRTIHAPLFIAHGTADQLIRVELGQEVFANANEPKELLLVEGAQHGNVLPDAQEHYRQFLERHLMQRVP